MFCFHMYLPISTRECLESYVRRLLKKIHKTLQSTADLEYRNTMHMGGLISNMNPVSIRAVGRSENMGVLVVMWWA